MFCKDFLQSACFLLLKYVVKKQYVISVGSVCLAVGRLPGMDGRDLWMGERRFAVESWQGKA